MMTRTDGSILRLFFLTDSMGLQVRLHVSDELVGDGARAYRKLSALEVGPHGEQFLVEWVVGDDLEGAARRLVERLQHKKAA